MSGLGVAWIWCALQVTLLGLAGGLVYLAARRFGPAVGSLVTSTTLLLTSCLTVLAFCPWPAWTAQWALTKASQATVEEETSARESDTRSAASGGSSMSAAPDNVERSASSLDTLTWFTEALKDELVRTARTDAPPAERNWWAMGGLIFVALASAGLLRVVLSFRAVHRVRRRTVMIRDRHVAILVSELAAELGRHVPAIELRESSELTSAATLGWLRPIILLPIEWREWTPESLRAVLAHELAHILRRDYLMWLLAQVGVALHAYHPVVHWLARRLRQDQECAADLTACQVVGGPRAYLTVLATMAIDQDDRRLGWSAHPFLPSRRTFLRRIEMLRDLKKLPLPPSRPARWVTIGALIALAILASGFRAIQSSAEALAQQQQKPRTFVATGAGQNENATGAISFAYVPRDAALVMVARPASVLNNPLLKQQAKATQAIQASLGEQLGLPLADVDQISAVMLMNADNRPGPAPPCIIIRTNKPVDQEAVAKQLAPNAKTSKYDDHTIYEGSNRSCCAFPDEQTILTAQDVGLLRRLIVAGSDATPSKALAETWSQMLDADAAVFANTPLLGSELDQQLKAPNNPPQAAMLASIAPLWQKTSSIAAGMRIGDTIEIQVLAAAEKAEDAKAVKETFMAATTLVRNTLTQSRAMASREAGPGGPVMLKSIDLAETVLDDIKISEEGTLVRAQASVEGPQVTQLVGVLASSGFAAQGAARRAQSTNNLKQLALAAHNFHDVHGHFPAAVVLGPDGKTTHSWRIELLPYLEQEALYRQYRMDEPWDSPNNKKVLEQMPPVFRDPNEPKDSLNSSYYVMVGKGTIFESNKAAGMQTILDGTSNTILFVEAQRDIPWTKPEDIEFDANGDLPEVGGHYDEGFLAALADGSVRFISKAVDPNVLKLMILKADGNVIPQLP